MRIQVVMGLLVAAGLLAGCAKKEEGGGATGEARAEKPSAQSGSTTGGGSTGVKECDDYLSALERCTKNAPPEAKAMQEQALKAAREAYAKADVPASVKTAWASACKQAADALSSTPYCTAGGGTAAGAGDKAGAAAPGSGAAAAPAAAGTEGAAAPAAGGTAADLFKDPAVAINAIKAKVGGSPVKALETIVYPDWAKMQAQDPKKPENIDEYRWRKGTLEAPIPVKLSGNPDLKTIETNLYSVDDVDFAKLPSLVDDANKRLAYEEAKVTHIIVKRGLPFSPDVRIRVYVNSPRKSGSVEYDAKGAMVKEYK
ncbi:MAG: hypothetical protein HY744_20845 [Deltaproteobacteria bacterium]|nr:hypothetical protein [Deltaproteobacteria bacterium]